MLGLIPLFFGSWLLSAWSAMIIVGILHSDWWSLLPTMGYGTAMAVTFLPVLFTFINTILKELS